MENRLNEFTYLEFVIKCGIAKFGVDRSLSIFRQITDDYYAGRWDEDTLRLVEDIEKKYFRELVVN